MNAETLQNHPDQVAIVLRNANCPYCSASLSSSEVTKEHVIGRKFVPRGKLAGRWNLILNACRVCNNKKSDLENDISAITLQPDSWGSYADDDAAVAAEAERKAGGSFSRRSGKLVGQSQERMRINVPFMMGATMEVEFVASPQLNPDRVAELAHMHFAAFFYWVTYDDAIKLGRFTPGTFLVVMHATKADWGNVINRTFMAQVANWEPLVVAHGADGFFRIIIRKHPSETCWSWGIEWNKQLRIVGFAGEDNALADLDKALPYAENNVIEQSSDRTVAIRRQVPLSEDADTLFFWEPGL